jgi:hypothetical protein
MLFVAGELKRYSLFQSQIVRSYRKPLYNLCRCKLQEEGRREKIIREARKAFPRRWDHGR